jgi:hypothetical protein
MNHDLIPMAGPTRILALSDTHFSKKEQVLPGLLTDRFDEVDYIVHAGDYTTIELVDELEKTGKFVGVQGNMDSSPVKKKLPEIGSIELGHVVLGVIHGSGGPKGIVERIHATCKTHSFNVVIFGHTHQHYEQELDGIKYFNPGSPVDKRFAKENGFLLLNVDGIDDVTAEYISL